MYLHVTELCSLPTLLQHIRADYKFILLMLIGIERKFADRGGRAASFAQSLWPHEHGDRGMEFSSRHDVRIRSSVMSLQL
jgi:hypothetical protein